MQHGAKGLKLAGTRPGAFTYLVLVDYAKRAGLITTVTSTPSRTGIPLMGGVGPAMAAVEQLTRNLSAELAPNGIRVLGLRPTGMPESDTIQEVFAIPANAWGITWEQFRELITARSHGKRRLDAH